MCKYMASWSCRCRCKYMASWSCRCRCIEYHISPVLSHFKKILYIYIQISPELSLQCANTNNFKLVQTQTAHTQYICRYTNIVTHLLHSRMLHIHISDYNVYFSMFSDRKVKLSSDDIQGNWTLLWWWTPKSPEIRGRISLMMNDFPIRRLLYADPDTQNCSC